MTNTEHLARLELARKLAWSQPAEFRQGDDMPLMECEENGKRGFKWGEQGKCFLHDGTTMSMSQAKRKAMQQAMAIKASQSKEKNAPRNR